MLNRGKPRARGGSLKPRRFQCEPLEPRIVLTGGLCITEFMASNTSTIDDSYGDSSDWIELYNSSDASINLSQFNLTDNPADPTKFQLPSTTIQPGEALLVFASNRDEVTAGGEIHTSFSLAAVGGYLALTDTGGNVLQDFGVTYPDQFEDVSYGIEMLNAADPQSLLAAGADGKMLIPTAANGPGLGTTWIDPAFNDASWSDATLPIGYDNNNTYIPLIDTFVPAQTVTTYLRIPFNLSSLEATSNLTLNVRYDDGFVAYLNGQQIAEDRNPASPSWDSTATSNHNDGEAVVFQPFDVASAQPLLQVGENVLAIHALNVGTSSSDYLFEATLEGSATGIAIPIDEGFLALPTPGSGNGEAFDGFVDEVDFGLDHGFYDSTQSVPLSTTSPGATIVYTTDGSDPTVDENLNPTNGSVYTDPISINETTVVRAAAFELNKAPSFSRARTYLFTSDVITQSPNNQTPGPGWPADGAGTLNGAEVDYGMDPFIINTYGAQAVEDALKSISSISISTDLDNLFSSSEGIYSNAQNRGRGWERFSSVELIEPDGSPGFQANAGLRIRGGFSRNDGFPKRSLRLFFRGEYGDSKLEYDFFGGDGAEDFDILDLRTSQNYSWANGNDDRNTYLREVFGRDAQRDMDQTHTRSRYHHLYLNGVYWGLYQTQERVEANFGESYLGGNEDDYDRVKNNNANGYRTEVSDGNITDWESLFSLAQSLADNPNGNADNYYIMQGLNTDGTRNPALPVLLDVDNLIDYQLILFHTGGFDSGTSNFLGNNRGNNWVAIRNRVTDDQGFQFFIHDNEHSMGVSNNSNDRTGPYDVERGGNVNSGNFSSLTYFQPGFLHEDLLVNEEYQLRFQDRVEKHFFNDGALTAANNITRLEERETVVADAILAESARWGDTNRNTPFQPSHWQSEVTQVKAWLNRRNSTVLNQLRNDGLHSTIAAPAFNQHGGVVNNGFGVQLTTSVGGATIFYTTDGTDPRLPGGTVNGTAAAFSNNIAISSTTTINARIRLSNGTWSALNEATFRLPATPANANNLRVSEINYHPADPTASELAAVPAATAGNFEFIEFANTSGTDVDLTGVQITSPINFTFPATTIGVGERVVVVRDQAAFAVRYSAAIPTVGEYGAANGLSNGGDAITVVAAGGATIQSFTYDDSGDWPSLADGGGRSLQIIDASGDYDDPLNWLPSSSDSGSPATAATPVESTSGLRITEFLYNPTTTTIASEFIEFHNPTAAPINLSGVQLVEGVEFDFTGSAITVLQPGEYAVVVENLVQFNSIYGAGLPVAGAFTAGSLSNGGERITLFDASGNAIHDFVYDDVSPWSTAPDTNGSSLEIVSTNGDYSSPTNWQPTFPGGTPGNRGVVEPLSCDLVDVFNGCDLADINTLTSVFGVTDAEISDWLAAASSVANPAKADPNHTYVIGDINLDGSVNSTDLGLLLNNFGGANANWGGGNLNADSNVNSTDLGLLLNNFGFTSIPVAANFASIDSPSVVAKPPTRTPRAALPVSAASYASAVEVVVTDDSSMLATPTVADSTRFARTDGFSVRDLVFGEFGDDDE